MNARTIVTGFLFALLLFAARAHGQAPDNPPDDQDPGDHSTICTSDGTIRDDELAEMIKDAIQNSGNTPSSVKVFFNSCYGGGMLDDIADALGPDNFPPNGIPLVGGSAAAGDQPAWGPGDDWASADGIGSFWTNGLAGAVSGASPGDSVSGTIGTANANDPTAPGGQYAGSLPHGGQPENPQNTSDHGGGGVTWSSGAEAVVFGGSATNTRHGNNVSNMEDAFLDMWGSDANSNVRSTGGNPNGSGSTQDLTDMINNACNDLDPGEELVIYVDDHGNTEFDFDEWWDHHLDEQLEEADHLIELTSDQVWESIVEDLQGGGDPILPSLHEGWEQGLSGNMLQGDAVEPGLIVEVPDLPPDFPAESFFDVFFDSFPLGQFFPGAGDAFMPIPHDPFAPLLSPGPHVLSFIPQGLPFAPFPLLNLELTSGPINDLEFNVPEPSSLILWFAALGCLAIRRRQRR